MAQGSRRGLIGTGRAAQAEVDAARVQRLERAELLGDHQRRMVRQHDATGADPDGRSARSHMGDEHRGGRAGNPRQAVMFSQPVALVAPTFGMLCQIQRVAKRCRSIAAFGDGREVEDGKWNHGRGIGPRVKTMAGLSRPRGEQDIKHVMALPEAGRMSSNLGSSGSVLGALDRCKRRRESPLTFPFLPPHHRLRQAIGKRNQQGWKQEVPHGADHPFHLEWQGHAPDRGP